VIIDVTFQDEVSITPAVMLQALRHLTHSLESNLQRKPNAPYIAMGGSLEKGWVICWLHFHTELAEQLECRAGRAHEDLDRKPLGDRNE